MQLARMGTGGALGIVVAFALFVLMSALIDMGDTSLDTSKAIKIADFTMPDTRIQENTDDELPDKPDDVEAPPPEMEMAETDLDAPDAGLNLSTGAGDFKPEIGGEGGFTRDTDMIPIYIPEPRYPPRALKAGKTGYAVVEVTVTTAGSSRDIRVLEEWPENFGFGRSAAKAAEKLKYNPRVVNGVAVDVPGVMYKFTFQLAGGRR
ncbi:MAG: energy transducer TonB [Gammaproteobacteria bacterium]|nr:energy transducer TonB [Gammaproteobacteria bacterium]NND40293.1 energy transducer TonB [Pseudomonadales bacterium]MBT8151657.1 energy transducer TonB [Gammaproteobacteria bacterium]NNL10433.1 energy transducer TonB [Pseudomonadales bacterium]NNM10332.1 energy transducer TonB [Pseudomonadales bacterium]